MTAAPGRVAGLLSSVMPEMSADAQPGERWAVALLPPLALEPVLPAMTRVEWVALLGVGVLLEMTGASWLYTTALIGQVQMPLSSVGMLLLLDLALWIPPLLALFWVFDRWRVASPQRWRAIVIRLLAMAMVGAGQAIASVSVNQALQRWSLAGEQERKLLGTPDLFSAEPYTLLGLLVILVAHIVMSRIHLAGRAVSREAALRAEAVTARLQALQAELQPHFLFNALNGIGELVHQDPARAEAMVLRLASLLRSTLERRAVPLVPLREELALVDDYLALQQMRFGDRLQVVRRVAPGALDAAVPPLMLQPVVENALVHGIERRWEAGVLELDVMREGDALVLRVSDDGPGPGIGPARGTGVGLRNIRERLAQLFGPGARLSLEAGATGGAVTSITLPYRPAVP